MTVEVEIDLVDIFNEYSIEEILEEYRNYKSGTHRLISDEEAALSLAKNINALNGKNSLSVVAFFIDEDVAKELVDYLKRYSKI